MLKNIINTIYKIGNGYPSKLMFYILLVLLFVAFLLPAEQIHTAEVNDKIVHATLFLLLFLMAHVTHQDAKLWRIIGLLAAYGLLTEFAQGFTPHRTLSFLDWLADVAGSVAGLLIVKILYLSNLLPESISFNGRAYPSR